MYKLLLVSALLLHVIISRAQNNPDIEATIRNLEEKVIKGILDADTNVLKQLWAPEFMVNTPRNDVAENRDVVFQKQQAGLINYSSFDRVIEKIQIQKNFVVTMGYETFVSQTDILGAKAGVPVKRRFTNVWMKQNDKWLQIARHASIICT